MRLLPGKSTPYAIQSMLLWAFAPVFLSFLPVFLGEQGFNASRIGIIMAINPFAAVLSQPFLGSLADRVRSKNRLFNFLMFLTVGFILLIPLVRSFWSVFTITTMFSLMQAPTIPISESISLELLDQLKKSYGPVRMMGNVGFMSASVLLGYLISFNTNNLFFVAATIGILNILVMSGLPRIQGRQTVGNKVPIREVFHDVRLRVFVPLSIVPHLSTALFMTYLPMFFMSIGGNNSQLGWIYFMLAASDFPFLMYADRIIKRVGIQQALGVSVLSFGLRFIILIFINAPNWMFILSLFHGLTFMIFGFGLAVYMNQSVRPELKSTGQAILAFASSIGRIIGTLVGGYCISFFGIRNTYFYVAMLCFITLMAYIVIMYLLRNNIALSSYLQVPKQVPETDPIEIIDTISGAQTFE